MEPKFSPFLLLVRFRKMHLLKPRRHKGHFDCRYFTAHISQIMWQCAAYASSPSLVTKGWTMKNPRSYHIFFPYIFWSSDLKSHLPTSNTYEENKNKLFNLANPYVKKTYFLYLLLQIILEYINQSNFEHQNQQQGYIL